MRMPSPFQILLSFCLVISICSAADEFDSAPAATGSSSANLRTSTLYSWPLTGATPTPLAKVTYSARTLTGSYELLPNLSLDNDELVRVGVVDSNKWAGSVARARIISRTSGVQAKIWLDGKGDVWHVEFARNESAMTPEVRAFKAAPGVLPQLNKPVVLNPDGRIPQPEQEKTLFQKYWWVLLAGVFIMMSGGGGGAE